MQTNIIDDVIKKEKILKQKKEKLNNIKALVAKIRRFSLKMKEYGDKKETGNPDDLLNNL